MTSEWMLVKEKLPDDGQVVLTVDDSKVMVLRFEVEKHEYNAKRWGKYFWSVPGQGRTWLTPTHWIPLPDLPNSN